jgi:hypothetical protein
MRTLNPSTAKTTTTTITMISSQNGVTEATKYNFRMKRMGDNNKMDLYFSGMQVDAIGSRLCPKAGFGIGGVEASAYITSADYCDQYCYHG